MKDTMFCWKQALSIQEEEFPADKAVSERLWLLQYSLRTHLPVLTLYLATATTRTPIATFHRASLTGTSSQTAAYAAFECFIVQAYPHEFLQPLPPWYTSNVSSVEYSTSSQSSEVKPEDEQEGQRDEKETNTANLAGDADAEKNAEDDEAIDKLTDFLKKPNKTQTKPALMFSLSNIDEPVGWGAIRLDLSKTYNIALSIFLTRAILRSSKEPAIHPHQSITQMETAYLTFLTDIILTLLSLLNDMPALKTIELTDLLRILQRPIFWRQQLLLAQNEGFMATLRPHRLIRLLPIRNWQNKNVPWPIRIDPNEGYFLPDALIVFLPMQLCMWIAAHIKVLVPDPVDPEASPLPPIQLQLNHTSSVLHVFTHFQNIKTKKRPAENLPNEAAQPMDVDDVDSGHAQDGAGSTVKLTPANHKLLKTQSEV